MAASEPPRPVNWRASVVVPVCWGATLRLPVCEGITGLLTGEVRFRIEAGKRSKHSLHHTRPSMSVLAALSSFLPQPGLPSSFLLPFASLPPHRRQFPCQRVPCGPGTTPRSIGDTEMLHPGHDTPPPNLGNVKVVLVAGALGGGRSYRLEVGSRVE